MAEKKTPIVIDGVEYFFEDMTQDQQIFVNHSRGIEGWAEHNCLAVLM